MEPPSETISGSIVLPCFRFRFAEMIPHQFLVSRLLLVWMVVLFGLQKQRNGGSVFVASVVEALSKLLRILCGGCSYHFDLREASRLGASLA
jgi:hypothetical protein